MTTSHLSDRQSTTSSRSSNDSSFPVMFERLHTDLYLTLMEPILSEDETQIPHLTKYKQAQKALTDNMSACSILMPGVALNIKIVGIVKNSQTSSPTTSAKSVGAKSNLKSAHSPENSSQMPSIHSRDRSTSSQFLDNNQPSTFQKS